MIRRTIALALAFALLPTAASAEDLFQTYELARAGDPQLAAAESNRLVTREGRVQARALMLPSLSGSASLSRRRTNTGGAFDADDNPNTPSVNANTSSDNKSRTYGVNLRQMVYDHSRVAGLKSQNALSEAADFQLESANDELIVRTSQAYFQVLISLETLAAAEAAEAALQKQFDYASKRLDVGLAPITDVHEARAQYDSARAATIVQRNQVEDAYQALSEITGKPVRTLKALPADFKPALPEKGGAEEWVQRAVDNNPALRAQELQVRSAEANVEVQRSGHFPTLYLDGGYSDSTSWGTRTFANRRDSQDSTSNGPNLGITLSVPIFSGGAIQSQVRQALAQRDAAQDQLEQQKRALVRSTRNAYQTLLAGISEVEARRLALVSAQAAYDASQVGLEVGTRTVLDVLTNQRNLFSAQQDYAQSKYNYLQNRILLEQAAGTLDVSVVQEVNRLLTADAATQLEPPPGGVTR